MKLQYTLWLGNSNQCVDRLAHDFFFCSAGIVTFPVSMFHNMTAFKATDLHGQNNYRIATVTQSQDNELSHQNIEDNNHLSITNSDGTVANVTMEVMTVDQS